MKTRVPLLTFLLALSLPVCAISQPMVIEVKPNEKKDMTVALQKAIDKASKQRGKPVEIRLQKGVYNISAKEATQRLLHVSNTTSKEENANPVKHIGLHIRGVSNLTIDGGGARFVTHGEMTPWVIDSCQNVTLKNFSIDAADPSLPEMTVISNTDSTMTARVNPRSTYRIADNKLYWYGEGWEFSNGIAQIYNPADTTTLRTDSPAAFAESVTEVAPGELKFFFPPRKMGNLTGQTYQMRHSFRNEVAGLIWRSENVTLSDIDFYFMGNFGVVAQFSRDITYQNLICRPNPESGRTGAGFADFFQVSGCKGRVLFEKCSFEGSHDDPINVHGTHLRIISTPAPNQLKVRFMHNQTFGFPAFYPGDSIAIVDPYSLRRKAVAVLKDTSMDGDYEMILTTDRDLKSLADGIDKAVLENMTWSPSVDIRDCYFTLTPTRGILVTTFRPVTITRNTFFRCPMSAILIADDAFSWYESGPVSNVTITHNKFIDCQSPVISISPEVTRPDGYVHENITITDNLFQITDNSPWPASPTIFARLVKGLKIKDNTVVGPKGKPNPTLKANIDASTRVTID